MDDLPPHGAGGWMCMWRLNDIATTASICIYLSALYCACMRPKSMYGHIQCDHSRSFKKH